MMYVPYSHIIKYIGGKFCGTPLDSINTMSGVRQLAKELGLHVSREAQSRLEKIVGKTVNVKPEKCVNDDIDELDLDKLEGIFK